MKKTILLLLSIFSFINIYSQEEERYNNYFLGGSFNFTSQDNTYPISALGINSGIGGIYSNSTENTRNIVFSISPYIGKQINAFWDMGLKLDYRLGNYKAYDQIDFLSQLPYDFERKSNQFGVGIFSRYNFNRDSKLNVYFQPYASYYLLNEEAFRNETATQKETASYIDIGVGIGLTYQLNEKFRVLANFGGLNYVTGSWEIEDTDTSKDFSSFNSTLRLSSLSFGLEMKL
jgi:hypothetical protein